MIGSPSDILVRAREIAQNCLNEAFPHYQDLRFMLDHALVLPAELDAVNNEQLQDTGLKYELAQFRTTIEAIFASGVIILGRIPKQEYVHAQAQNICDLIQTLRFEDLTRLGQRATFEVLAAHHRLALTVLEDNDTFRHRVSLLEAEIFNEKSCLEYSSLEACVEARVKSAWIDPADLPSDMEVLRERWHQKHLDSLRSVLDILVPGHLRSERDFSLLRLAENAIRNGVRAEELGLSEDGLSADLLHEALRIAQYTQHTFSQTPTAELAHRLRTLKESYSLNPLAFDMSREEYAAMDDHVARQKRQQFEYGQRQRYSEYCKALGLPIEEGEPPTAARIQEVERRFRVAHLTSTTCFASASKVRENGSDEEVEGLRTLAKQLSDWEIDYDEVMSGRDEFIERMTMALICRTRRELCMLAIPPFQNRFAAPSQSATNASQEQRRIVDRAQQLIRCGLIEAQDLRFENLL